MVHAVLYFTILLVLVAGCYQQENVPTVNWGFGSEILRSYLCTGNREWYKDISTDSYPTLRFIVHAQIELFCRLGEIDFGSLNELVEEARYAAELQPGEKRNESSKCLWRGIKYGYFAPIVCSKSDKLMENLDNLTSWIINDNICNGAIKKDWTEIVCMIGQRMIEKKEAIRDAVRPYLCRLLLRKRQFDLKSLIEVVEQTACLQISGYNFKEIALKGGWVHFPYYGYWCCITKFFDI